MDKGIYLSHGHRAVDLPTVQLPVVSAVTGETEELRKQALQVTLLGPAQAEAEGPIAKKGGENDNTRQGNESAGPGR